MEIDARYFGRGATLRLLVGYFNNPRLKRFLSCSRRGAPPGRRPPFGERDVAEDDGIMPIVPAQRVSGPLQPCLYPHFSKHRTLWFPVIALKGLAALSCCTVTHFDKMGGYRADACVTLRRSCP